MITYNIQIWIVNQHRWSTSAHTVSYTMCTIVFYIGIGLVSINFQKQETQDFYHWNFYYLDRFIKTVRFFNMLQLTVLLNQDSA